jgi:hypothetical protein
MDVTVLRDRIQATLDPNAAIRQQAELDLKHVRVPAAERHARRALVVSTLTQHI